MKVCSRVKVWGHGSITAVEEKVYCKYEWGNSQRHLEGSRLNQTMRGGGREDKRGREEREQEYLGTQRPRGQKH
ncbi:hypothetical protein ACQP3J_33135, partial [Escherichia coli]